MGNFKAVAWIIVLSLLIVSACGKQTNDQPAAKTTLSEFGSEDQVIAKYQQFMQDKKLEDALAVLDRGLQQYPASNKIGLRKYLFLRDQKRYEECLLWLRDVISKLPEEKIKDWIGAKIDMLLPLISRELKKENTRQAFLYLEEMADAGYRGFHQLRRNEKYEALRKLPGFETIMKKIADNTGIGQQARDFTALLTTGDKFTLSAQKEKVILVDFWSTSCGPCIRELPNLREIYFANKEKGFDIISISLDDNKNKLSLFLKDNPMPWKTVYTGKGWKDDVASLYKVTWIPALWLVDRKGILRYFDCRGPDLKAAVEELIAR